ncbi:hypothetical protein EYF80_010417 [Liparis tanakae]|uniref:Uncharacterized protein n=1 Tax=Liparis tanakae TaxID=230148 RepID=A0A4Z2IQF7_9TELE|nr:hypothetical protein EYF80_010417 [Liparis tanakae]
MDNSHTTATMAPALAPVRLREYSTASVMALYLSMAIAARCRMEQVQQLRDVRADTRLMWRLRGARADGSAPLGHSQISGRCVGEEEETSDNGIQQFNKAVLKVRAVFKVSTFLKAVLRNVLQVRAVLRNVLKVVNKAINKFVLRAVLNVLRIDHRAVSKVVFREVRKVRTNFKVRTSLKVVLMNVLQVRAILGNVFKVGAILKSVLRNALKVRDVLKGVLKVNIKANLRKFQDLRHI